MARRAVVLYLGLLAAAAMAQVGPLLSLNSADGVVEGWEKGPRKLEVVRGAGQTTDGDGALQLTATSGPGTNSHYFGLLIPLPAPRDLRNARLLLDARSVLPETTRALYVRLYNQGETRPAASWQSWDGPLTADWRTFSLQPGMSRDGLLWEAEVCEARRPTAVARIELIIGTRQERAAIAANFDNLRVAAPLQTLANLQQPKALVPQTALVRAGQPLATVLHGADEATRQAAQQVVALIRERTGVSLPLRAAAAADRQPDGPLSVVGCLDSNPALELLYARYLTPVDSVCPGAGGALVQVVHDPFGKGVNTLVLGASDAAGLAKAVELLRGVVAKLPAGRDLVLPPTFERAYSAEFLKRWGWADDAPAAGRVAEGLAAGQKALDEGAHTSIAGVLEDVARRYQLTASPHEARLFVELWKLYGQSAVADPRKYGGPWGFDSDFPAVSVVSGWDVVEEDPSLTAEDRLLVTRTMARWLSEAVIPKCAGAARTRNVLFNHQTFPGLGALLAGLYFTQGYDLVEGADWLRMADALFRHQAQFAKVNEDCNGYQWLTNGHLLRYCLARPDRTWIDNGQARRTIDYLVGSMDNLYIQVPYGDTGSWQCWSSEQFLLNGFAFLTGDPAAAWVADRKAARARPRELYNYPRPTTGSPPTAVTGVRAFALEPRYRETFPEAASPPVERCIDKISFRAALDPQAEYLLYDGLANGGHKHLDGNSLPRLTQFDRIWLADNDYFKAQVKYHNSVLVFRDGQSDAIPPYAELRGVGETARFGYSRTRLSNYAGVDWDRGVVWLKELHAFVVLDQLTARVSDEYQFRLLWHGVGAARLEPGSLLLSQRGPALRIDVAPGPRLSLHDDPELGTNWAGYQHADPVVRSLSGVAQVRLQAGETYCFASVLHGAADGEVKTWPVRWLRAGDGILLETPRGPLAVSFGPLQAPTPAGDFDTDAQMLALDAQTLTLLGAQQATAGGLELLAAPDRVDRDLPLPQLDEALAQLPTRPPVPNLGTTASAPAPRELWNVRPQPTLAVLSANRGLPGGVTRAVKLTSDPLPAAANVFAPEAANRLDNLLDGSWANSTATSAMYEPDQTVSLTLDLAGESTVQTVRWWQWWATNSSRNTKYLLGKATVLASNDGFVNDRRVLGEVTDPGPHPNFGAPWEYRVTAAAPARQIRLVIQPQPGSAVYLAELVVHGTLPAADAGTLPFDLRRLASGRLTGDDRALLVATGQGTLLARRADGSPLWQVDFPGAVNDVTCADLDGDGRDEVIVARQDFRVTVLGPDGRERWTAELKFYRRPPNANLVRTGDLTGDGRPEVIVGGENWRFYAFDAAGQELWNYESVHPSQSGAVADLNGDGKAEVICGTHYYQATALQGDGTRQWAYSFGPICYDVATGSFDGNATRGVVFGGGDGVLHYVDSAGKARLKADTGDEVRQVACADLDGDGQDEILGGSLNYNLFCFGADARRRWRVDLGSEVTALTTAERLVLAGTADGAVWVLDGSGQPLSIARLGAAVVDLLVTGDGTVVATADGRLRRLAVR
ncbi:MAG: PQQ-binding-like beta-propeller repeat protein [Fimbriimonadaceae bacterium]|nr:PQQ-binding-like beta-propeller repeat protein [Fimbriimonadaceae bacterium]